MLIIEGGRAAFGQMGPNGTTARDENQDSWKLVGHPREVTLITAWLQADHYPTLSTE